MNQISMLIADDHQIVIDGIKAILKNEKSIQIIKECTNGKEVVQYLIKHDPVDILILDINMPEMDGIECAQIVKDQYPEQKILILTMYDDPQLIRRLMEIGADGFVLKNTGKNELLEAINRLMNGSTYFSQDATKSLANSFKRKGESTKIQLTRREKEVLKLLYDGLTTQEIADTLFISSHTVDSHRKNLLSKFNLNNTTSLLREAGKLGFV